MAKPSVTSPAWPARAVVRRIEPLTRVRNEDRCDFTKHMIRLRHANQINDAEANQIVLLNSHDGNRLRSTLATTQQLITQAQGLAFQVQSMDQQFAQAVRRDRERQSDVPGRAPALAEHAQWLADRDADAGAGVAERDRGRERVD